MLRMLAENRLKIVLSDKIVAQEAITKFKLSGIKMLENPLFKTGLYLVFDKNNPRAQDILDLFNKGIEKIKKSGEYDQIMINYGVTY